MTGTHRKGKSFLETCWAGIVLGLPCSEGTFMRGGWQYLLGGLGRKKLPDTVRPNGRIRWTKCVLVLMTRLAASRVVRGFLVMKIMMLMIMRRIINTNPRISKLHLFFFFFFSFIVLIFSETLLIIYWMLLNISI